MVYPVSWTVQPQRQPQTPSAINESPEAAAELRERIVLALAIADEATLRSLFVDCYPQVVPAHRVAQIHATLGVPVSNAQVIDGVLHYDVINCVLADAIHAAPSAQAACCSTVDYQQVTRCQTPTQTLGRNIVRSQAESILAASGFSAEQIATILHLPEAAWHRSWWYVLNKAGELGVLFHRRIRTRHYSDGTYTLQYQDYFAQESPPCFRDESQRVLIKIHDGGQRFSQVLADINAARQHLGIQTAILISDSISELEAQGYINQGVHLYAMAHLLRPIQADCLFCNNQQCPMQGRPDSPVRMCDRFDPFTL